MVVAIVFTVYVSSFNFALMFDIFSIHDAFYFHSNANLLQTITNKVNCMHFFFLILGLANPISLLLL